MLKTGRISRVMVLLAINILAAASAASGKDVNPSLKHAGAGEATSRFVSPKGRYEAAFTELERKKYTMDDLTQDFDNVSNILYRIDFFKKHGDAPISSTNYHDVYGWEEGAAPASLEVLFKMIEWSPEEDIAIIPDEGWAGAPGTAARKAISLDPKLEWKEAVFAFDGFFWTDGVSGIGDRHGDCDYSVERFDGKTGKTVSVKPSESPAGYEFVSVRFDLLTIRKVMDNCAELEKFNTPPDCFILDLNTKKETPIPCPVAEE